MTQTHSGFIVSLTSLSSKERYSPDVIGGKASGLARLMHLGFRVPPGFVVTADALRSHLENMGINAQSVFADDARQTEWQLVHELLLSSPIDEDILAPILTAAENLQANTFAVRSSGTLEDGVSHSFAGLFESALNVGMEQLEEAIKTAWASFFADRVRQYNLQQGLTCADANFAVVIQKQIAPIISGVGFSVDPVRGLDRTLTLEVCDGLGDRLVGGTIDPLRVHYDWQREDFIHASGALAPEGVKLLESVKYELVESLLQLQRREHKPIDIEWCADADGLHFLQMRPITSVSYSAIDSEWTTADFKDGGIASGPCTPLMWSLYQGVFCRTMPSYLQHVALMGAKDKSVPIWAEMYFGRPYWNVGAVKRALARLPGFVERDFDKDLGIEPHYQGQGTTTPINIKTVAFGLRTIAKIKRSLRRTVKANAGFVRDALENVEFHRHRSLAGLSDEALYTQFKSFYDDCFTLTECTYFTHIYNTSNAMTLFKDKLRSLHQEQYDLALYGGLDQVAHNDLNIALWRLSRAIRRDDLAVSLWQLPTERVVALYLAGDQSCEFDHFRALVDKYGYHATRELDLLVPRYAEDVTPLIDHVKSYINLPDDADPQLKTKEQAASFDKAKADFLSRIPRRKRRRVNAQLTQLRSLMWLREELRDVSIRHYLVIRLMLNAIAQRQKFAAVLVEPSDIYFLRIEEVIGFMAGRLSAEDVKVILAKAKTYYHSFYDFRAPNEIGTGRRLGPTAHIKTSQVAWQGIPCSAGRKMGVARVIKDVTDVGRVQRDDILVTQFTDPAWTPTFGLIAGVVTETGGVLSHGAVIAREYGIPAVLGVNAATNQIKDGDLIIIDGDTGCVSIPELSGDPS